MAYGDCMWEILVPTERRLEPGKYYTTRYHRVWDEKVRAITGGLTIMQPAKGQWVSPAGLTFIERMIPVRIVATRAQIEKIIDITMDYYDQLAVLCYKVSDEVIIKHRVKPAERVIPATSESARILQLEKVDESGRKTVTDVHLLVDLMGK